MEEKRISERILNFTLEIIRLLNGEDYVILQLSNRVAASGRGRSRMSPLCGSLKRSEEEILLLTNKIIRLLGGEKRDKPRDREVFVKEEVKEEHAGIPPEDAMLKEEEPPLTSRTALCRGGIEERLTRQGRVTCTDRDGQTIHLQCNMERFTCSAGDKTLKNDRLTILNPDKKSSLQIRKLRGGTTQSITYYCQMRGLSRIRSSNTALPAFHGSLLGTDPQATFKNVHSRRTIKTEGSGLEKVKYISGNSKKVGLKNKKNWPKKYPGNFKGSSDYDINEGQTSTDQAAPITQRDTTGGNSNDRMDKSTNVNSSLCLLISGLLVKLILLAILVGIACRQKYNASAEPAETHR